MIRRPPRSALFPSPTLFRSVDLPAPLIPETSTRSIARIPSSLVIDRLPGGAGLGLGAATQLVLRGPCRHEGDRHRLHRGVRRDRKSTRLNSSHANISYAVFC